MFSLTKFNINFIFIFIFYGIYNAKLTYILYILCISYVIITSHTILNLLNLEKKYILRNYNIIIYKVLIIPSIVFVLNNNRF